MRIATSTRTVHLVDLDTDIAPEAMVEVPAGVSRLVATDKGRIELTTISRGSSAGPWDGAGGGEPGGAPAEHFQGAHR